MGLAEKAMKPFKGFIKLVQIQLTQPLKLYEEMNDRWHKTVQTAIRLINF